MMYIFYFLHDNVKRKEPTNFLDGVKFCQMNF